MYSAEFGNFRPDEESSRLIGIAKKARINRSEFIRECIKEAGPQVLAKIAKGLLDLQMDEKPPNFDQDSI